MGPTCLGDVHEGGDSPFIRIWSISDRERSGGVSIKKFVEALQIYAHIVYGLPFAIRKICYLGVNKVGVSRGV